MPFQPLVRPAWRGVLAAWAGLAVVIVGALGIALHDRQGTAFDTSVVDKLTRHIGERLSSVLLGLSSPGISIGVLAMVLVAALLVRSWPVAALVIIGPPLALGMTELVLKPLVNRGVTFTAADGVSVHAVAYPSGHETGLVSMLVVLALLLPRLRISVPTRVGWYAVLTIWAVLGAAGLVRAFYHYATDTIGGAAVAIACVCGTALALDSLIERMGPRFSSRRAPSPEQRRPVHVSPRPAP